jgi:hypothetical protein
MILSLLCASRGSCPNHSRSGFFPGRTLSAAVHPTHTAYGEPRMDECANRDRLVEPACNDQ